MHDIDALKADLDGLAILRDDFGENAGGGRRHLDRHLVGFEFDERFIRRDALARLLEPLRDSGLCHRLAQRGHANFRRHWGSAFPNLSSSVFRAGSVDP